jgi:hypothetical protein
MSDNTAAISEISRILDIYDLNPVRIQQYLDFYSRDTEMLEGCDAIKVAMTIAALEGNCANPPTSGLRNTAAAAWGYTQTGVVNSYTFTEYAELVEELETAAMLSRKTTAISTVVVEQATRGLRILADILETDSKHNTMPDSLNHFADILDNTLMESDSNGDAIEAENPVVDFLLDNIQSVSDFATALLSLTEIIGRTRNNLDEVVETMDEAYETLTSELN